MNKDIGTIAKSDDLENDSQVDEACFHMLELAAKTRSPSGQIIVGIAGCELAAVIHFIEPGTGEEYADWLELLEVKKALAESAGEPGIPLEQILKELALEMPDESGNE